MAHRRLLRHDVVDHFRHPAADADSHHRAEQRIAKSRDKKFRPTTRHALDKEAIHLVSGSKRVCVELAVGLRNIGFAAKVDRQKPGRRAMRDGYGNSLENNGHSDVARDCSGFIGAAGEFSWCGLQAGCGEEGMATVLGNDAAQLGDKPRPIYLRHVFRRAHRSGNGLLARSYKPHRAHSARGLYAGRDATLGEACDCSLRRRSPACTDWNCQRAMQLDHNVADLLRLRPERSSNEHKRMNSRISGDDTDGIC